jgi:hypothetical protein
MCFAIWVKLYYIVIEKLIGIINMKKEYKVGTKTFSEEDFKNPPPLEKRDIWYKLAYADWARDNGLTIKFNNEDELDEYFHKKLYRKKHEQKIKSELQKT